MSREKRYRCSQPDCGVAFAHEKNICRHLRIVHGKQTRPRGRPRRAIERRAEFDHGTSESQSVSHDGHRGLQLRGLPSTRLSDDWWAHQSWYREIRDKHYHWNRNGLLENLLRLPRLDDLTSSESGFVRVINPGDLPRNPMQTRYVHFESVSTVPQRTMNNVPITDM